VKPSSNSSSRQQEQEQQQQQQQQQQFVNLRQQLAAQFPYRLWRSAATAFGTLTLQMPVQQHPQPTTKARNT
jgi:hypothetical protein